MPTNYWDKEIIDGFNSGRLTILTGSAISMFSPTFLPTGSDSSWEIKKKLIDEYVHKTIPDDEIIQKRIKTKICRLIKDFAFESVMDLLMKATSPFEAEQFIHKLISTDTFNLVHEILAGLMVAAPVVNEQPSIAIITTNYDLGIENAISEIFPKLHYRRIVTKKDSDDPLGHEPLLFKIHGSDAPIPPYQFVMTHDQEASLPQWQNRLVHQLVDERVLLIAGYSGMDLDILPVLRTCRWKAFRSVRPLEGLSGKRPHGFDDSKFSVHEEKETLGAKGDLQEAFQRIYNVCVKSPNKRSLGLRAEHNTRTTSAMSTLSYEQKSLWLALMTVQTGGWVLGNRILDNTGGSDNPNNSIARATIFFYAGRYRDCARQLQKTITEQSSNLSLELKVDSYCSASGSLNCAGDFWGTWLMIIKAVFLLFPMFFSNERMAVPKSFGHIIGRIAVAIPFASYIINRSWMEKFISGLIRKTGMYSRAAVISQYAKPSIGALSLGNRASLINEYRYSGVNALNLFESGNSTSHQDAMQFMLKSLIWAREIDDYPGLCKTYLGMWRLYLLVDDPVNALECWRKGWQFAEKVDYIGWRGFLTRKFAMLAEKTAQIVPESSQWQGNMRSMSYRLGKIATALLSVS